MGISQDLYKIAKEIIPGGTQLLSKRPEMFLPGLWPAYYSKALGCKIWDLDGNEYIDMSCMGVGSCILGYADCDVNAAVKNVIDSGNMATLNSPEEVELAQILVKLHPWSSKVRYARTGGEAMVLALRIARAHVLKDKVLFCGYHGWHDWYLSANLSKDDALGGHLLPGLSPRGVPRALAGSALTFSYNDTEGFLEAVKKNKGEIGAIVMEPLRNEYPEDRFINTINEVSEEIGAVLIVDEITAGWRLNLGGAHLGLNLKPDIAVFAKAISNGYPMAAVIGKKRVMDAAEDSFISSTYWTERVGPAAAIATIKKMQDNNVSQRLIDIGKKVQDGWKKAACDSGIAIHVGGIYPLSHFAFEHKEPLICKTLFVQLMLERGFLATTAFYASWAHSDKDIQAYLSAVYETFAKISKMVKEGNPGKYLKGPVCHNGFKRLA